MEDFKDNSNNPDVINDTDKKINIIGTSSRYQIKKATYKLDNNKERNDIKKL